MSRLWRTDTRTDTHVKVEQYSAEAESAIKFCIRRRSECYQVHRTWCELLSLKTITKWIIHTMPSLISGTALNVALIWSVQHMAKAICIMDQLLQQTILSLSMNPFWPDKRSWSTVKGWKIQKNVAFGGSNQYLFISRRTQLAGIHSLFWFSKPLHTTYLHQ